MKKFSIIVAMDAARGIGSRNTLPWHLPADLKHFKEVTTLVSNSLKKNVVIMGRRTWESLPEKFRPLPQRINVVLSSSIGLNLPKDVLCFSTIDDALKLFEADEAVERIFVIGGAQIFAAIINHPQLMDLYVTQLKGSYDCDVFFPPLPPVFFMHQNSDYFIEKDISYRFVNYIRKI